MKILGVAEGKSFQKVPGGRYKVAYNKFTEKGGRKGCQMRFKVLEGEFKGNFVFLTDWPEAVLGKNEAIIGYNIVKDSLMHKALTALSNGKDLAGKDPGDFLGEECIVEVKQTLGKDEKTVYCNVVDVFAADGAPLATAKVKEGSNGSAKTAPAKNVRDDEDEVTGAPSKNDSDDF